MKRIGWWRGWAIAWGVAVGAAVFGAVPEPQLRDPGFEGKITDRIWNFGDHGQTASVRFSFDSVNYATGAQSLLIRVDKKPRVYVFATQYRELPPGAARPSSISVSYLAPAPGASLLVNYNIPGGRKNQSFGLPPGNRWQTATFELRVPSDAYAVIPELRVDGVGEFRFDDLTFGYAPVSREPQTLLLLGVPAYRTVDSLNRMLFSDLGKYGWKRIRAIPLETLAKADLDDARLVVLLDGGNLALDACDRARLDALIAYVKAGGGLVVTNFMSQQLRAMSFPMEVMKALGGRILLETVEFPAARQIRIGEYGDDIYSYTDRIFPPLNDGVKNVLIQSASHFNTLHGLMPFLPNREWKTVLTAGRDIGSKPFPTTGLAYLENQLRPAGFSGDTPLAGIREFGAGRAAYLGVHSYLLIRDFSAPAVRPVAEATLRTGVPPGPPSDFGRFLRNLFDWTSANSSRLDRTAIPPLLSRADFEARQGGGHRLFRGVVGPRTTFSGGKSTPEEYAAKAKKLGHDFIVFLEDFSRLTPEKYESLRKSCERLTDDRFTAIAGFAYQKDNGSHQYVFSFEPIYPGRSLLTPDGRRFRSLDSQNGGGVDLDYLYGKLGFNNNAGWFRFGESPYRATDNRTVQSLGLVTRENGKTVEIAWDVYKINNRNGQLLLPLALERIDSAEQLTSDSWRSVIGFDGVAAFRKFLMSHGGSNRYPDQGFYGSQSVTNGPEIEFELPRGDMNPENLWNPILDHWPYTLKVSSAVGLATVEMFDGDTPIRRWTAGGSKSFARSGVMTNDRQRYLWVRATDVNGGVGVTRSVNSNSFLLREMQCNDRENQLFYSSRPRPNPADPPFFSGYGADTCTPDKGPWVGRVRPVGFFVFDEKLGMSVKGLYDGSPEDHPQVNFVPCIYYNGESPANLGWCREFVAGREGGPHVRPERVVAGSNALVGDRVLDGVFDRDRREVIHVWHSLFPVRPGEYADTVARCILFLPKVDGIVPYQWEQTLTLRRPIPTAAGKPFLHFGSVSASSRTVANAAVIGGKRIDNGYHQPHEMRPGDFLVLVDKHFGSLAVFPLTPVSYRPPQLLISGDGATAAAGSRYDFKAAMVGMNKFVADPVAFAGEIARAYGIGGTDPVYRPRLTAGTARPDGVLLAATAADGALAGTIEGLDRLPGNLGLRLTGMRDNVSAVVAIPGKMRIVPVEKGVAYAVLDEEQSGRPLFVGHPFRADSRELTLALARKADLKTWILEVHNPTGRAIVATITNDPRFDAIRVNRKLTVPAGDSVVIELE